MDLSLSKEQTALKDAVRDLVKKEITPIASEIDETGRYPEEIVKHLAEMDLYGILIPPPFGGQGCERIDFGIVVEELAKGSASIALCYAESVCAAFTILAFGTDEQRMKYLPALAKGEKLATLASTEPSGGSNWAMTLQTDASADGSDYVINGRKCFISNAGEADIYVTFVRTDFRKGPMGISAVIIEKGTEGMSFGSVENKLGLRGHRNAEIIFDNCRVAKENLLGMEGDPLAKIAPAYGALHCTGHAAIAAGIARASLDATINHVKAREVMAPNTLAHFDGVQNTIAEMAADTEASELLAYRAAFSKVEQGPDPGLLISPLKANELALEVASKAITLHGGYGATRDYPLERYFRDAKTLPFISAVFNFHKLLVGRTLLGIPLEGPPAKHGEFKR